MFSPFVHMIFSWLDVIVAVIILQVRMITQEFSREVNRWTAEALVAIQEVLWLFSDSFASSMLHYFHASVKTYSPEVSLYMCFQFKSMLSLSVVITYSIVQYSHVVFGKKQDQIPYTLELREQSSPLCHRLENVWNPRPPKSKSLDTIAITNQNPQTSFDSRAPSTSSVMYLLEPQIIY